MKWGDRLLAEAWQFDYDDAILACAAPPAVPMRAEPAEPLAMRAEPAVPMRAEPAVPARTDPFAAPTPPAVGGAWGAAKPAADAFGDGFASPSTAASAFAPAPPQPAAAPAPATAPPRRRSICFRWLNCFRRRRRSDTPYGSRR